MAVGTSPEYGRRLIPQILDRLAATEPDRIVFSITSFSDNSLGFRDISARDLAKAVDKTAWWIRNHVGKQHETPKIQTLGYIGPRKSRTSK